MIATPSRARDETLVHYRVELIVLRHLDSAAEPDVEPALEDYSGALDIIPTEQEAGGEDEAASEKSPVAEPAADPYAGSMTDSAPGLVVLEELPPPPAIWVDTPGDTMQEAWRRLRLSAGFRPVLYFSWEQPDAEPYPRIRVHDDRVIWVDDPYLELRAAATGEADPALSAPEPLTSESIIEPEAEIPEPELHFALDGTARLRHSRFLHLELDIAWRERVEMLAPTTAGTDIAAGPPDAVVPVEIANDPTGAQVEDPLATPPDAVRVHRLRQSRQVSTGDLQYFDGPWFGVLALVTRIERAAEPPPQPEPIPAAGADTTLP